VQTAGFLRLQGVGAAAWVQTSAPERFTRVDVAEAGDTRLVQEEVLQGTFRCGEQLSKTIRGEVARETVDAKNVQARANIDGFPVVNAAEVAAIGKTKDTFVQFESDIDMRAGLTLIGALEQFLAVDKPEKLAVELKVHGEQSAIQNEEHIFAPAIDDANATALSFAAHKRIGLRLRGDGVKDMDTTDSPALDKRTQRANNGFHFREFRHGRYGIKIRVLT
jgi:hypothetical protein